MPLANGHENSTVTAMAYHCQQCPRANGSNELMK